MNSIKLIFLGLAALTFSACQTTDSKDDGRYKNSQAKHINLNKLSDVQICNAATTKEGGVFWESGRAKSAEAKLIAFAKRIKLWSWLLWSARKSNCGKPKLELRQ